MSDFLKLYRAAPERFALAIDTKFSELESEISDCSKRLESLSVLGERFLKTELPTLSSYTPATCWVYVANLPNLYFHDVFEAERAAPIFKRWVGRSGRIGARLALARALQYDFVVHVADFISEEIKSSFALTVDGQQYPWLDDKDGFYRTIILERVDSTSLEFELSIDINLAPPDKDVTFSFAKISFDRRG